MSATNIINLLGGIALFLYGMTIMGAGLEKIAGGKMQGVLQKLTKSPLRGLLLGALITAVIQSSAGTVVIVIGLVNSGIMALPAAVGVIMGANIGTTITGQIIALSDLGGSGWLSMLKPTTFAPLVAFFGTVLYVFIKQAKKRNLGQIMLGFGILFIGMSMMDGALAPLKSSQWFIDMFTNLSNPLVGVMVGLGATVVVQSSSASVGILQALTSTGLVTFASATPAILGAHVGTAFTPLLACSGASRDGKRVAVLHIVINVITTVLFLVVFSVADLLFHPAFFDAVLGKSAVANIHTLSSAIGGILLLPAAGALIVLGKKIIKDGTGEDERDMDMPVLDEKLFGMPAMAVEQAKTAVEKMAVRGAKNYRKSMKLLQNYSQEEMDNISRREDILDRMEVYVSDYLIRVSDEGLSVKENQMVNHCIKSVTDFERIGDYAINLAQRAAEMKDKELAFSDQANTELMVIGDAIAEITNITADAFRTNDPRRASEVEPLEETVDVMCDTLRTRHIQRLKDGVCQIEQGIIFLDLLTNIERISDHCSNVAARILSMESAVDVHAVKQNMHDGNVDSFNQMLEQYKTKYCDLLDAVAKVSEMKQAQENN